VTSAAYPGTAVDARNLVAAEVRSRVERMGRVAAIAAKRAVVVTPEQEQDLADWIYMGQRNERLKRIED